MKKLVIYYTYTGNTGRLAQARAAKEGAELYEIHDVKRPGMLKTFFVGCFNTIRGNPTPIRPITVDLSLYDRIIIMAPIWAGQLAAPVTNVFHLLPEGKEVEVVAVSDSGKSKALDRTRSLLQSRNCELVNYENIRS